MLILLAVLCVGGIKVALYKFEKEPNKRDLCKTIVFLCAVILVFEIPTVSAMYTVVRQNDTGYLENQIYMLTEQNKYKEKMIEKAKDKLQDEPEMLNYIVSKYNEEITFANEEIQRCMRLKNRVDLYRWLLYFK